MFQLFRVINETPQEWITQIAKIHCAELSEGVLRNLGPEGLEIIYAKATTIPDCGLWCAVVEHEVCGFILGCANIQRFYKSLFFKSAPSLIFSIFPRIIKTKSFGYYVKTLLYPFARSKWSVPPLETHQTEAELLAIAVKRDYHHRGVGRLLLEQLEIGFKEWGVKGYYHVATDARDPLSNAFYTGMGFRKYGVKKFTRFSLQVYEKEFPVPPEGSWKK